MLDELAVLQAVGARAHRWVLVDEDTGDLLMDFVGAGDDVWVFERGYLAGIDGHGFFVRQAEDRPAGAVPDVEGLGPTLFRSHRFRQRVVGDEVELSDQVRTVRLPMSPLRSAAACSAGACSANWRPPASTPHRAQDLGP
jgi:hypothetical protein